MSNEHLEVQAAAILAEGSPEAAVAFLVDRSWDTPPEPDWMPESRNWALVSVETCAKLIELALSDAAALTESEARTIVEAIWLCFGNPHNRKVTDWKALFRRVPNGATHLAKIKANEEAERQELADIEAGRSRMAPMEEEPDQYVPDYDDYPVDDDEGAEPEAEHDDTVPATNSRINENAMRASLGLPPLSYLQPNYRAEVSSDMSGIVRGSVRPYTGPIPKESS